MDSAEQARNPNESCAAAGGTVASLKSQFVGLDDEPGPTKCMLCDEIFVLPTNEKDLLTHLFQDHRLVIGDVWKIASLKCYLRYWRTKFKDEPFAHFCTTLSMDCTPDGKPSRDEHYFLLSDCITEDKTLRDELHRAKLDWVLTRRSQERTDTSFRRGCIFCRMQFSGSRVEYVKHLSEKHNLYIGKPENLVFLDELLDKIQVSVERLVCIYCEKIFKDRTALKEHMRKKLHKRINPSNKDYDKFYINNYLNPGGSRGYGADRRTRRNREVISSSEDENEEASWSDWKDESIDIVCLFCTYRHRNMTNIFDHLKAEHDFDFPCVTEELTFYQKVKLVNYIRRQVRWHRCILCETEEENVSRHMKEEGHCKMPARKVWDQPEFYFPSEENDSFLYSLDATAKSEDEGVDGVETAFNTIEGEDIRRK